MSPGPRAADRNGVLWVVAGGRRVALVVEHGRVTEAWPPFLGRWAVGKTFRWVFDRHDPDLRCWQPDVFRFRASARHDTRPLRRWQHPGRHISKETDVTLGTLGVGERWYVYETGQQDIGWCYPTVVDAVAEVEHRLALGGWARVAARFDGSGRPQPEVDVPELAELDKAWPLT
jgi:hypothetical protein